jgi:hypothetical protein
MRPTSTEARLLLEVHLLGSLHICPEHTFSAGKRRGAGGSLSLQILIGMR